MNQSKLLPKIAVIIATKNRCNFLAERSLPSVISQTCRPDFLIVCDDSSPDFRASNAMYVASVRIQGCEIIYLENHRTSGASGCWNSAIDILLTKTHDPYQVLVAFLDDDDAWSSAYLESCLSEITADQLDMVAADLSRIETIGKAPKLEYAPKRLRSEDFLTKNPGIQGSNLFLRLSVLLQAGCFDEALQSTTDRDLCIRLADLGTVRYSRLAQALVAHYADTGRTRLSTRGSPTKLNGLTTFWQKYSGRMNSDQKLAFSQRATELFDWELPSSLKTPEFSVNNSLKKAALVLGIIPDPSCRLLLTAVDTLVKYHNSRLIGLDIILLDDGGMESNLIDDVVNYLRDAGAGCFHFRMTDISALSHNDSVPYFGLLSGYSPTDVLSICSAQVARWRIGSDSWIIEDFAYEVDCIEYEDVQDLLTRLGAKKLTNEFVSAAEQSLSLEQKNLLKQWFKCERVTTARHRVMRKFSLKDLRYLGYGSEAVVFTDGQTVFKCIDYWKTRTPEEQLSFLRYEGPRWIDVQGIYPLRSVEQNGFCVLLTYQFEESIPYKGGHEDDLIKLLDDCTNAGIVCNNIHPKNLVVTVSGVKLIDYGSDIRSWSPLGFEHMALRTFVTCRHANHPNLKLLMKQVLTDQRLHELAGYQSFRAKLLNKYKRRNELNTIHKKAPVHEAFTLYVGVITSDPWMLLPLLRSLGPLQKHSSIRQLSIVILDNACPENCLKQMVHFARQENLNLVVINEKRQRQDARSGIFGSKITTRPAGLVGIALARTMLQRYLGSMLQQERDSIGWFLDDDMRIDDRSEDYLGWLPAFRNHNVDVLLCAYEGSSPNPPLNGLRVQLVDLYHNLLWLKNIPEAAPLPDRSNENAVQRKKYPDYYYDLSRKHFGHLEMPHWLEPMYPHETVGEARSRLLAGALGILNGDPLTRPIVPNLSINPLDDARDSVNRGGCTFVLNPDAITRTPNSIMWIQGREARRSDMIWAIVNRHYRHLNIKAVDFPVHHIGRITDMPGLNKNKVQSEIIGSALYAGLTDFLETWPDHELDFSTEDTREIGQFATKYMEQRLLLLEQSFYRIKGLCSAIRKEFPLGEVDILINKLEAEFNLTAFQRIQTNVKDLTQIEIHTFLTSLRSAADDYAYAADLNMGLNLFSKNSDAYQGAKQ